MADIDTADAKEILRNIDPIGFESATQVIGATLWRIQLLEETVASYLVLKLGLTGVVARAEAESVLEKTRKSTLGQVVREINDKVSVSEAVSSRLSAFVESRNWLVHRSQQDCGVLLRTEAGLAEIERRMEAIADEALAIQKLLAGEIEAELVQRGVDHATIKSHLMSEVRRRAGID